MSAGLSCTTGSELEFSSLASFSDISACLHNVVHDGEYLWLKYQDSVALKRIKILSEEKNLN